MLLLFLQPSYAFEEPVITSIGIEQGLSNNSVRCILQDHKGFMWFGTYDGLNRYDGYGFKTFRNQLSDATSLRSNFITALGEDRKGQIWVGTRQGLSILNPLADRFFSLSLISGRGVVQPVNDVIKDIKTDPQNNVLVGTENLGLLFCKKGALVARQVSLEEDGKKTTVFGVQALKIGSGSRIWVFVQNRGLCLLDGEQLTLRLVNSVVSSANCLEAAEAGLWIGTSEGVYYYDFISGNCIRQFSTQAGNLSSDFVVSLKLTNDKKLWIGTNGGGIDRWDFASRKMDYLPAGDFKNTLTSGAVSSIYEDRENRKWIGTLRGGINLIDPQRKRFQVVAHEPGKPGGFSGNFVSCFFETPDSNLYIGTEDAGFNYWDRRRNRFQNFRSHPGSAASLPTNTIVNLKGDAQNNLWIAVFPAGISRFQPSSGTFKNYHCINPATGTENQVVYALCTDRNGVLWVSTLRQGNKYGALYYYNKNADRFDALEGNLSDLFSLYEDRQGAFWGGNLSQLVRIDRSGKKHRFYPLGHAVRAIYEDSKGNFWIGTEGGGLLLFDRSQNRVTSRFTTENGLCNNSVLNILEDRLGYIWMSTQNGLSRLDPVHHNFKNYYQSDGLQSNQFNYNAALALRSGELAFGGIKGFSLFRPGQLGTAGGTPAIVLTSILVDGKSVGLNTSVVKRASADEIREIEVPFNQAIFSFGFSALEYSAPDKIAYAYFMEGWDKGWNYSGKIRTAAYTHLPAGSYVFHVRSTNAGGEWSSRESVLKIDVLPPWYRSGWAYGFYLLLAVAAFIFYQRYRTRQTRLKYEVVLANLNAEKQRAQLEMERAERERKEAELEMERAEREKGEAELARAQAERETERIRNEKERELIEKSQSFFTYITHEFRTPLTLVINPVKELLQKQKETRSTVEGALPVVYRNARRLLSMVDQLLLFRKAESGMDTIRPAKLDVCSLGREVYLCFVQQAKSRNISYEFACSGEPVEIYADPQKLEIILYNLLSNALKYTGTGGRISFVITEGEQEVEIRVTDTGAGIPKDVGDRLFEKFYQPERKNTESKSGFGIGLYLVRQFTDQHRGQISYQSEEGKGTTFILKLLKGTGHFGPEISILDKAGETTLAQELREEPVGEELGVGEPAEKPMAEVVTEKQTLLLVDDDEQMRQYLAQLFKAAYIVHQAESGERGLELAQKYLPDLVISDVNMQGISGIELCRKIKEEPVLSHIPVILLTASSSDQMRLQGVEGGADDYITKPFDSQLLLARVSGLLKNRTNLQKYFYNEITLNKTSQKISPDYKQFLEKCIAIVESHLEDDEFSVKTLVAEMHMSHTNLLKKVKSVSGQSINTFIRYIRLRKAAELLITTNSTINEVAFTVGIRDIRYFREQFNKLFGMNPSDYIRRYRHVFGGQFTIDKGLTDTMESAD